ncbi:MAG: hypothetical protein J7J20_05235 [Desulfurococcales archaeon]|nr:hypothetical protein [Desulfurococcales archaeon]
MEYCMVVKKKKVLVSREFLAMVAAGKVRYVEGPKIRLGRWVLKKKKGEFIGCEGEDKN